MENLNSLDRDLMEKFVEKAGATGRVYLQDDLMTNLAKLKLIQGGKPTLAAMLLFGNHGYAIHIGRFKAADTIIDDLLTKEPLITALAETMVFIKKHINLSYDFDGSLQRKERWQYPLEALRELLLNAVVHRDYKLSDGRYRKIRNGPDPDTEVLMEYPEIKMNFSEVADIFRIEFISSAHLEFADGESETGKLPEIQRAILDLMRRNPRVTYIQLSEKTGKSKESIRRYIESLKASGFIRRVGPAKGGHWRVV